MANARLVALVLFFLQSVHVTSKNSGSPITCEAGNFQQGQKGRVTCHFGINVNGSNFYIRSYPLHGTSEPKDALRCHLTGPYPECKTAEGFHFDNKTAPDVAVDIPTVNAEMAGRYECNLVPSAATRMCNLTVNEVNLTQTAHSETTQGLNDSTRADCPPQKDIFYEITPSCIIGFSTALVISGILNLIFFGFIFKMHIWPNLSKAKKTEPDSNDGTPASTKPGPDSGGEYTAISVHNESDASDEELEEPVPKNKRQPRPRSKHRAEVRLKKDVLKAAPEINKP